MYRIHVDGSDVEFECHDGDSIMRAAIRAGFAFPYECNVGQCGSCRFEVLEGEVRNTWDEAPALTARDKRKGLMLGCQTRPLSDCRIKVREDAGCLSRIRPARREVVLAEVRDVTHDMREFCFRSEGPVAFLPGQYALLHLPGVNGPRAYSMCNQPNQDGEWRFLIKRIKGGSGTAYLFDVLGKGDALTLDGPYGLAYLRENSQKDIACIAGGSGLSPLISIATAASRLSPDSTRKIRFFFGGRGPADICGEEYLRLLPGFGERITFHSAISVPELDPGGMWIGPVGFIHESVENVLGVSGLHEHEFYIAGPPPMLQATLQMLAVKHKVGVEQIHFDRFF